MLCDATLNMHRWPGCDVWLSGATVLIEILYLTSSLLLGLLMGSLLTEAVVLVPYWCLMDAQQFLNLHGSLGPKLYLYFSPLTIAATVLLIAAALAPLVFTAQVSWLAVVPEVLVLTMLGIYFVYFKGANESLKNGSVGVESLAAALERWARCHWVRVGQALAAFLASLIVIEPNWT